MCCRRHTSLGGRWDPQPWLEKQPKQGEQRGGGCRTQPCLRFCAATPRNESKEAKREEKPEKCVMRWQNRMAWIDIYIEIEGV
ncbi:hypothetical protein GW17_00060686 [Ensete ventricosum]|nr:hypothetical protein GW17_00060686 [Ensete ventricosum]